MEFFSVLETEDFEFDSRIITRERRRNEWVLLLLLLIFPLFLFATYGSTEGKVPKPLEENFVGARVKLIMKLCRVFFFYFYFCLLRGCMVIFFMAQYIKGDFEECP